MNQLAASVLLSILQVTAAHLANGCSESCQTTRSPDSSPHNVAFDVATIKRSNPKSSQSVGVVVLPSGRIRIHAVPLKALIKIAFNVSSWQIKGGDSWIEQDLYDIEAESSDSFARQGTDLRYSVFGITDERIREMLQSLLVDRFKLKYHFETKTGTIFLLTCSGKKLELQPTSTVSHEQAPDPAFSGDIGFAAGRWSVFNTSMAQLARFASENIVHRTVVDETNLSGAFSFQEPTRLADDEVDYRDPSDSFLRLIPEMGLRLERTEGPVQTFVIDYAEGPSPN